MHVVEIILDTECSSTPAEVKITCNSEVIFNDLIKERKIISHNLKIKEGLDISISKFGKTQDIPRHVQLMQKFLANDKVDAGHKQIITIEKVKLNGIDLKIDSFGVFSVKNNLHVPKKELQTTMLTLNGEWSLSIPPTYSLPGQLTHEGKILQRKFINSDVCCFGASNTYRPGVECWPHHLANLSKLKVQNYGIRGSGWLEITRMIEEYSSKVKDSHLIILSPFCFRFQIQDGDGWSNCNEWDLLTKEAVLHGAEHYVAMLSGHLCEFLDKLSALNHIYICPDNQQEYDLFQKTPLKKYLIRDIEFPDNQLLDDGHWNDKWNKNFAEKTAHHIGIL